MSKQAQFNDLRNNPPECIGVGLKNFNFNTWEAFLYGPQGSPYEGGLFTISIDFPDEYPTKAPVLRMVTPIYHPNIDDQGLICIDIIRGSWKSHYTMRFILNSIMGLMKYPNPENPWPSKQSVANEYKSNYRTFFSKARDLTARHAM